MKWDEVKFKFISWFLHFSKILTHRETHVQISKKRCLMKFISALSICFLEHLELVGRPHRTAVNQFALMVYHTGTSSTVLHSYSVFSWSGLTVSAFSILIFDLIKIRSNVLKEGYRVQNLFCDNNLWFRDFVITRNQVASHLVVIFWYVHVIYNFEYSSRDVFTVMFKLVPTVLVILSSIESQRIPV